MMFPFFDLSLEMTLSLFLVFQCPGTNAGMNRMDNQTTSSTPQPLYLLTLLPYPDPDFQPSWAEGPTLTLAAQLAVDIINNRTDILPGYNLELVSGDSGCDISSKAAVTIVRHIFTTDQHIAGIVGPGCSSSASFIAPLISCDLSGLLSVHIASSPDDREANFNAFGTLDSTDVITNTILVFAQQRSWKNVTLLFDESKVMYLKSLERKLNYINRTLNITLSLRVSKTHIPVQEIKRSRSQIVILLVDPDFLSKILCLGYYSGVFFNKYQWVIASRTLNEVTALNFTYLGLEYSCNEEQIKTAVNRSVFIHYRVHPSNVSEATSSSLTYDQFNNLYTKSIEAYNMLLSDKGKAIKVNFLAPAYFDAVWSLALALNNSREEVKERTGLDLSEYRYGHSEATGIIRKHLLQLDFKGLSGSIRFNNATGYVSRVVDIYQVVNNTMELVEYFNGTDIVQIGDSILEYIDDSVALTVSRPPLAVGILFMVISLIGLLLLIASQVIIIIYHNYHSVKAASPKLLHLIAVGGYFWSFSCIAYIIIETFSLHPKVRCGLFQALNLSAITTVPLIFGSISGKTWRLYRIFVHYLNPGCLITDKVLFTYIAILVIIQFPVLISWVIVEPLSPAIKEFPHEGVYIERCISPNYRMWFGFFFVYEYCYILLTVFLALLCHQIPHRDFKTDSIILLVNLLTIDITVGFPVYFAVPVISDKLPEFLALNVTLILAFYLCLVFILFPPIWPIFKEKLGPYVSRSIK